MLSVFLHRFRNFLTHKGFTLLEVMIAMTLFSVMALFLMRITDSGVRYQKIITKNIKNIRNTRSVWQVLRQDFYNVFLVKNKHVLLDNFLRQIRVVEKPSSQSSGEKDLNKKEPMPPNDNLNHPSPNSPNSPASSSFMPPNTKSYLVGQFKGTDNQLYFTTLSDKNTLFKSSAGDSYLVFYYLKPCKNKSADKDKSCLWRKSFSDITADPEKNEHGIEFMLLENVKKIQLSYFNILDNEWKNRWPIVIQSGHLLPVAVKILLEFKNKKKQIVKEEMIVPIHKNYISLRMLR